MLFRSSAEGLRPYPWYITRRFGVVQAKVRGG
jgi:hypothetical protein